MNIPDLTDAEANFIARVTYEANRAYCEFIGDSSQPAWKDAPLWQRDSAAGGVRAIAGGAARTPEEQHESWLACKRADGWVYGETKDPEKKTHPCFLPYDQLPPNQRFKDHLFRAVALAILDGRAEAHAQQQRDYDEFKANLKTHAQSIADQVAADLRQGKLSASPVELPAGHSDAAGHYETVENVLALAPAESEKS